MTKALLILFFIALCNVITGTFFQYDLPNRTAQICPTNSLISLECPQTSDNSLWQSTLPLYSISIDYIRSYPARLGNDPNTCQPDLSHTCNNYDLRYINTLCNGKSQCLDIPAYQIRDRSSCAFKAITEIVYHCVPTWNLREIKTKCDICKNGSLTNDYGFIYSRNYPLETIRKPCFTTIYARPYHKTVLYIVTGQLNFDQLTIESVSSEGLTILNITLNGNQTTQKLAVSTYEMKITYIPSMVYSSNPTNYLLYFYTIPYCTITDPCQPIITTPMTIPPTTTTITTTTSPMRVQSIGWSRVPNIWIIIPIILAYVLLLILLIILALLFQRRRKQRKLLQNLQTKTFSSGYLNTSGTSSRAHLVTPPINPVPPPPPPPQMNTYRRTDTSQTISYSPFVDNFERYQRESRSEFDMTHASIPYRTRPITMINRNYRPYGTIDYSSNTNSRRSSLPKSFSDCDLCRRQVINEEYQSYYNQDDNWHLENSCERRIEPRSYREKIKERFRERLTVRNIPDTDVLPSTTPSTVEYSTVLPRRQRLGSEPMRPVQHLPFEYISNDNNNVRTVEYKRNSNQERVSVGNTTQQQYGLNDECGTANFTVKFYERDDEDDIEDRLDRCLHEAREVQEMSMRMSEQQFNRHHQQQQQQSRSFTGHGDV